MAKVSGPCSENASPCAQSRAAQLNAMTSGLNGDGPRDPIRTVRARLFHIVTGSCADPLDLHVRLANGAAIYWLIRGRAVWDTVFQAVGRGTCGRDRGQRRDKFDILASSEGSMR